MASLEAERRRSVSAEAKERITDAEYKHYV